MNLSFILSCKLPLTLFILGISNLPFLNLKLIIPTNIQELNNKTNYNQVTFVLMQTQTKIFLAAVAVLTVAVVGLVLHSIILKGKLEEQTLKNGAFKVKAEQREKNLNILRKEIAVLIKDSAKLAEEKRELLKQLNELPTDNEVIVKTDIRYVTPDSSWRQINSAINLALSDSINKP